MRDNNELLTLLENDSRLTPEQLALMLDKEVGDIKDMIEAYKKDGVILGYKTLVDWDKTDREYVTALIELKVAPQRDRGCDARGSTACPLRTPSPSRRKDRLKARR